MTVNPQIPSEGPLSSLTESDWTNVSEYLSYGGTRNLHKAYRIPLTYLHYNIENGRYRTKYELLKKANPGVHIDPREERWSTEITKMLNGTFEDPITGVNTRLERSHFEALKEDIRNRGQERPGIVLESGGVISGNRRLAALRDLYQEAQETRFGVFEAFMIPGRGSVSATDRWRLEMSAQVGQARLTRNYSPIERLLKIEEGIRLLMEHDPQTTEDSAINVVANDFGADPDTIKGDYASLVHIREYLEAIGHPEEWWKVEGLTEVFTEVTPTLADATQSMRPADRGAFKRQIFHIIKNKQADYELLRTIRSTIGSSRPSLGVPSAINILLESAPGSESLATEPTPASEAEAAQLVENYSAEVQARRDEQKPLKLADRAVTNLRTLNDVISRGIPSGAPTSQLVQKITEAKDLSDDCLSRLNE